jgi:hypothetical protein
MRDTELQERQPMHLRTYQMHQLPTKSQGNGPKLSTQNSGITGVSSPVSSPERVCSSEQLDSQLPTPAPLSLSPAPYPPPSSPPSSAPNTAITYHVSTLNCAKQLHTTTLFLTEHAKNPLCLALCLQGPGLLPDGCPPSDPTSNRHYPS